MPTDPPAAYDPATTIAAVADANRRVILDRLRDDDGRPVKALEEALPHLGRHAVLKHVGVLEWAGLVVTRKVGRRRLCYLNPVPLLDLARQWTTDYSAAWGTRLLRLHDHTTVKENAMSTDRIATAAPDLVQQVVIHAPVTQVWEALVAESEHWYFDSALSTSEPGQDYVMDDSEGRTQVRGTILESDPPHLLVQTFDAVWDNEVTPDAPSHLTWRLHEHGPLTFVTVEHRGVQGTETGRQAAGGWPYLLSNLKTYVETGTAMPSGMGG